MGDNQVGMSKAAWMATKTIAMRRLESVTIILSKRSLGMVVMLSKEMAHGLGTPSGRGSRLTCVGIERRVRVRGATVMLVSFDNAEDLVRTKTGRRPAGSGKSAQ